VFDHAPASLRDRLPKLQRAADGGDGWSFDGGPPKRSFGIEATAVDGLGDDYAKALRAATESGEPRLIHARAELHPPATTTPYWPLQG